MHFRRPTWGEERLEIAIGRLLIVGVLLSAVVVVAGGLRLLTTNDLDFTRVPRLTPAPDDLRRVSRIAAGAARGDGRALIQLGVVLLIWTPVARVSLSAFSFLRQRDRFYAGVTLFVLAVLLLGLFVHGA